MSLESRYRRFPSAMKKKSPVISAYLLDNTRLEIWSRAMAGIVGGSSSTCCVICHEEFTERDILRVFPCGHYSHQRCVDRWLTRCVGLRCVVCNESISSAPPSRSSSRLSDSMSSLMGSSVAEEDLTVEVVEGSPGDASPVLDAAHYSGGTRPRILVGTCVSTPLISTWEGSESTEIMNSPDGEVETASVERASRVVSSPEPCGVVLTHTLPCQSRVSPLADTTVGISPIPHELRSALSSPAQSSINPGSLFGRPSVCVACASSPGKSSSSGFRSFAPVTGNENVSDLSLSGLNTSRGKSAGGPGTPTQQGVTATRQLSNRPRWR